MVNPPSRLLDSHLGPVIKVYKVLELFISIRCSLCQKVELASLRLSSTGDSPQAFWNRERSTRFLKPMEHLSLGLMITGYRLKSIMFWWRSRNSEPVSNTFRCTKTPWCPKRTKLWHRLPEATNSESLRARWRSHSKATRTEASGNHGLRPLITASTSKVLPISIQAGKIGLKPNNLNTKVEITSWHTKTWSALRHPLKREATKCQLEDRSQRILQKTYSQPKSPKTCKWWVPKSQSAKPKIRPRCGKALFKTTWSLMTHPWNQASLASPYR